LFNKLISYEVLIGQDNRWILDTTHSAKANAMTRAQSLLDSNQHDAIRVTRLENDANEKVIFHKVCAGKADKPITISAIEESAVCAVADDFYGFEARKTVGRLLRKYLEEQEGDLLEVRGIRIKLLPKDIYNYAPEREDEDLSDRVIVHYHGPRKAWMLSQHTL